MTFKSPSKARGCNELNVLAYSKHSNIFLNLPKFALSTICSFMAPFLITASAPEVSAPCPLTDSVPNSIFSPPIAAPCKLCN